MMKKRGYLLDNTEENLLNRPPIESIELFDSVYYRSAIVKNEIIESTLSKEYIHTKRPQDIIKVFYINFKGTGKTAEKILQDQKRQIIDMISNQPIRHVILISRVEFKTFADLLDIADYYIEHFLYSELLYDPTVHFYQSEYKILNTSESSEYLKHRKLDANNLKRICIDDPPIKFLGGRFGQVVKINRHLKHMAGVSIGYDHKIITNESIYHEQKKQ